MTVTSHEIGGASSGSVNEVATAVRDVAAAMLPDRSAIAEGVWKRIASARPDLMSHGLAALERAEAGCHSTNNDLLRALSEGTPLDDFRLTTEIVLATRALVDNGFTEDDVMSGYRLGTAYWCEVWADSVDTFCPDSRLAVRVVSQGTSFALGWLDMISTQVMAEFRHEKERLSNEGSAARLATVRRILAGGSVDERAASMELRYDVTGEHLAFVLSRSTDSDDEAPLEMTARALASGRSRSAPLIVRLDADTTLCWISADDAVRIPALRSPAVIGQGRTATGLDGFRRTYREATEALRVARLANKPAGAFVRYADVELIALCSKDSDACRDFVQAQLGPLADDTEDSGALRETLRTYFESHCGFRAAASRLGVHHNTVRYRLERIGALLGRSVEEHRLTLEVALELFDTVH